MIVPRAGGHTWDLVRRLAVSPAVFVVDGRERGAAHLASDGEGQVVGQADLAAPQGHSRGLDTVYCGHVCHQALHGRGLRRGGGWQEQIQQRILAVRGRLGSAQHPLEERHRRRGADQLH